MDRRNENEVSLGKVHNEKMLNECKRYTRVSQVFTRNFLDNILIMSKQ